MRHRVKSAVVRAVSAVGVRLGQRLVFAGLFAAIMAASPTARADEASKLARAEYDAGAAAYERKDYGTAAKHFALADEHVPNSRALQLAMAASLSSSDPVLGMELADRADARAVDGSLAELSQRLRKRYAGMAGRVRLVCPADAPCRATVDDRTTEFETGRAAWVTNGRHVAHIHSAIGEHAAVVDREVVIVGGATVDVTAPSSELTPGVPKGPVAMNGSKTRAADTTPPQDIVPERRSRGLAPAYFWTALGATAVAAGTATVFTIMTKSRHDDFVASPSQQTADDGQSAQTRARIVWGVTGAFAATTIVLAALTDFGHAQKSADAKPTRPQLSVAVGPGSVLLVGRFR